MDDLFGYTDEELDRYEAQTQAESRAYFERVLESDKAGQPSLDEPDFPTEYELKRFNRR